MSHDTSKNNNTAAPEQNQSSLIWLGVMTFLIFSLFFLAIFNVIFCFKHNATKCQKLKQFWHQCFFPNIIMPFPYKHFIWFFFGLDKSMFLYGYIFVYVLVGVQYRNFLFQILSFFWGGIWFFFFTIQNLKVFGKCLNMYRWTN